MDPLVVRDSLIVPASELSYTVARSSGPGGQNVNKVSSKVDLRFDLENSTVLQPRHKARIRDAHPSRIDTDGILRVVVQDTRDQLKNLALARERLADIIRASLVDPKPRRATKPTFGSKLRRLDAKKQVGEKKRDRRGGWDGG